jgi:hypothetical protein
VIARRRGQLHEFVEDPHGIVLRDSDARIDHVDPDAPRTPSRAQDDSAGGCVSHRVRQQIAQYALQQRSVGRDGHAGRHDAQHEARRHRLRRKVGAKSRKECLQGDWRRHRPQRSGFELRQIEQLREEMLEGLDRRADACDQRCNARVAHLGRERRSEEPHRVQRLPQVMARGGEKLLWPGSRSRRRRARRAQPRSP